MLQHDDEMPPPAEIIGWWLERARANPDETVVLAASVILYDLQIAADVGPQTEAAFFAAYQRHVHDPIITGLFRGDEERN